MGVFICALPCRTRGPKGICQAQWVPQNNNALPSYLLDYTRVKMDIRSSVHLLSVEPGLTEVGQR